MDYNEKAKVCAKELAMEYVREGSRLNKCGEPQDIIDDIADIFEKYYNAILNNEKFKELL